MELKIKNLTEEKQIVFDRIQTRVFYFTNLLEKIIKEKAPSKSEQQKLIQGGNEMKFRGITIHKNKTCNTWYTRFTSNGKQIYISSKTQQDCYNKLKLALKKQEQANLKQQKEPGQKSITFIEWYNKWLKLYKNKVKEATIVQYKACLNHLQDIVNKPLSKITSLNILEVLNKINGERMQQKVYELAKAVFDKAVANDIIANSPFKNLEKPKHKKINGNAFSSQDEQKIIEIFRNQNLDIFLVGLYQGLRRGEMLALTREDIDYENKILTINKAINNKNKLDSTKNTYSDRVMPIFDNTLEILQKYKNIQGRLFNFKYDHLEDLFKNAIENKFTKNYTIHSLRHTFVTKCQEANIPLHIIQKWVGHNIGSEVTAKVYTHSREIAELENIEKMNNYK